MTKLDFLKTGIAFLQLPPGLRAKPFAERAICARLIVTEIWGQLAAESGADELPEYVLMAAIRCAQKDVPYGVAANMDDYANIARDALSEAKARWKEALACEESEKVPY